MSHRLLLSLLASAVALGAFTTLLPSAPAGAETWSARLLDLTGSYGSEAWKYDLGYEGQATPAVVAAHLQNQTTSYYGALGLRLTLKIQIYNVQDANAQPTSDHNVTATIDTAGGPVFALVKREGTSATFYLDFDLDGANNAAPDGRTPPPVEPGLKTVQLNILHRVKDNPPVEPAGEAQFQFTYTIPYGTASNPAFAGLLNQQPVPDNIFRLFTDVGWDRSVPFFFRPLEPSHSLELAYDFGPEASGQTVDLYGFLAELPGQGSPGGPAPAPGVTAPFVPGVSDNQTLQNLVENSDRIVTVNKKRLATSRVDADGGVRFLLKGSDLLAVRDSPPVAGLVAVAPLLVDNFDPSACPGDCRGGAQYRVGATELVVPVTARKVDVDSYELADPAASGQQAPPAVRDVAIGANALEVRVRDRAGFTASDVRTGDAYALVPDARSATPLAGADLSRGTRDASGGPQQLLSGSLPVRGIQAQHVTFYRVLGLLYEANDAFYGAAFGDRGYTVQVSAPVAIVPPGAGGVYVNITSRTTNYDVTVEKAFDLKVYYRVAAPDLKVNESRTSTVPEGGTTSDFFPLTSSQAGSFAVTVDSTSGDTLPRPNVVSAEFREPPAKKGFADRIPGPEASLLLLVLAGVVLVSRRR
jgi:hypothetical protein